MGEVGGPEKGIYSKGICSDIEGSGQQGIRIIVVVENFFKILVDCGNFFGFQGGGNVVEIFIN